MRTRTKSGDPSPRRSDFSPLCPASSRADLAEGQVDLVVEHQDAVELEVQRPTRRPDRVAGFVHEGLGPQDGDTRASGAGATVGEEPGVLLLGTR
jgi:hypothetical protein